MSLRRRFIWGVLLSALVASWAYYAEYLPFTGKWIASYRLEQYAKESGIPDFGRERYISIHAVRPMKPLIPEIPGKKWNWGAAMTD